MLEYLSDMFGKEHINKQRIEISGLPIYMNSYEYELYTIFNKSFIFMKNKNEFNINSYLKHRIIIEDKYSCDDKYLGSFRIRRNALYAWKCINANPNVTVDEMVKER